jgi:catalase
MMEGFGIHTYRLLTRDGKSHFVKWHWKPRLGLASLVWDEAQKISGMNPDFLNEDLWTNIENGNFPQWDLGLQVFTQEQADEWDFDILDATKIVPENLVPVKLVGTMTLNRNVDNFFAETEQVAFHPGNIVPGIDFTNDPLLQGRLHSYLDTQLIRLGGPNFSEIPINRPITSVANNQRNGHSRHRIDRGRVAYEPNALAKGCPFAAGADADVFLHYAEKMSGHKVRERSDSFSKHFTQATLFWNSQTEVEKQHIIDAASFEVGKVTVPDIRERMVKLYYNVNPELGKGVAANVGVEKPDGDLSYLKELTTAPLPSDAGTTHDRSDPALSIEKNPPDSVKTMKVAVLVAENFDQPTCDKLKSTLEAEGAQCVLIGPRLGSLKSSNGKGHTIEKTFSTDGSPLFDALVAIGSDGSYEKLISHPEVAGFLMDAFRHKKPMAALAGAEPLLKKLYSGDSAKKHGLVTEGDYAVDFLKALKKRRFWERPDPSFM